MYWKAFVVAVLSVLTFSSTAEVTTKTALTSAEWRFVCDSVRDLGYSRVNCRQLERPILVVSAVVDEVAKEGEVLYGFTYGGEPYVFLNDRLTAEAAPEVAVHETTHYVLGMAYPEMSECLSETVARQVGARWAGIPYDDTWRSHYEC